MRGKLPAVAGAAPRREKPGCVDVDVALGSAFMQLGSDTVISPLPPTRKEREVEKGSSGFNPYRLII